MSSVSIKVIAAKLSPSVWKFSFNHKRNHNSSFLEHPNRCELTIKKQRTLKKTHNSHQSDANKWNHTEPPDSILSIIQEEKGLQKAVHLRLCGHKSMYSTPSAACRGQCTRVQNINPRVKERVGQVNRNSWTTFIHAHYLFIHVYPHERSLPSLPPVLKEATARRV